MHISNPRYLIMVQNMMKIELAIMKECVRWESLTEGRTHPVPIFLNSAIAEQGIIIACNTLWKLSLIKSDDEGIVLAPIGSDKTIGTSSEELQNGTNSDSKNKNGDNNKNLEWL